MYVLQWFWISSSLDAPLVQFGRRLLLQEHGKAACPQPWWETSSATSPWLPPKLWTGWQENKHRRNLSRATVNTAGCKLVSFPRETWIYPNTMLHRVLKKNRFHCSRPLRVPTAGCPHASSTHPPQPKPSSWSWVTQAWLSVFSLRVWTGLALGARGHEGGVNESVNTALLFNSRAERGALQPAQSCSGQMWGIHRILVNLDHFTFIEGFYYSFLNFVCFLPLPPPINHSLVQKFPLSSEGELKSSAWQTQRTAPAAY